jgi:hypothetical protein
VVNIGFLVFRLSEREWTYPHARKMRSLDDRLRFANVTFRLCTPSHDRDSCLNFWDWEGTVPFHYRRRSGIFWH